ncbi:DUF427 domain-containing protein [Ktedonospora formicarum]|uniref:DUF427 domain-containing protein n=1 Tax=Ktedonospora formicarum TaxID=2778364 RepID=A0A8J3MXW1_9CHLR|nr:DUF427 domain-containing protein [Ktedonospora formicarum]GHO50128.1 hypothetical protein KSX_82910 [Ktedonospora formicarum]
MVKATWNGITLAESDKCVVVEGNQYFPPESVRREYLKESSTHTTCPWKGEASYYSVEVNGETNNDAAWYYPAPKEAANQIKDHIAFWRGVNVEVE